MSLTVLNDDVELTAPASGAAELATLLSVAVRIEAQLIRSARLILTPRLDVGAEADLWFSAWVAIRSSDSIVLRPQVRAVLQSRLAARLAADPSGTDPVWHAWDVIKHAHARSSPALQLEEYVTWLAAQPGNPDIDGALKPALRAALIERRTGVSEWFARAWHSFPQNVQSTVTAWQLAQIANAHVQVAEPLRPRAANDLELGIVDAAILADALDDVRLGIIHNGSELIVGADVHTEDASIAVPATDPRILEVIWTVGAEFNIQILRINEGATARVNVGSIPVWIRTSRGAVHEVLPPAATRPADMSDRRIFISYIYDVEEHRILVQKFWRFLRNRGYDAFAGLPPVRATGDSAQVPAGGASGTTWIRDAVVQADFILVVGCRDRPGPVSLTASDSLVLELLERPQGRRQQQVIAVLLPGDSVQDLPWFVSQHGVPVFTLDDVSDQGAQSLLAALTGSSGRVESVSGDRPAANDLLAQGTDPRYAFRVAPVAGGPHISRERLTEAAWLDVSSRSLESEWEMNIPVAGEAVTYRSGLQDIISSSALSER